VRTDPLGTRAELEELLRLYTENGDDFYAAMASGTLAWTSLAAGDVDEAMDYGLRSVRASSDMRDSAATAIGLHELAILIRQLGWARAGTIVDGAVRALGDRYGVRPPPVFDLIAQGIDKVGPGYASLPEEERLELEARGAAMTIDEAVDFVAGVLGDRDRGEDPTIAR
jgi:hypothetical protein